MQQQNVIPTAPQSQAPIAQKLSYAPPSAAFVPLKLAEARRGCNSSSMLRNCKQ